MTTKTKKTTKKTTKKKVVTVQLKRLSTKMVAIDEITIDDDIQPRVRLDSAGLARYEALLEDSDETWPFDEPVSIVFDEKADVYYLCDGFHRAKSCIKTGRTMVKAKIYAGDRNDAIELALVSNQKHGVALTTEDKRHQIARAMTHPRWKRRSDRFFRDMFKCRAAMVKEVRERVEASNGKVTKRVGKDGKEYDASGGTRTTSAKKEYPKTEAGKVQKKADKLVEAKPDKGKPWEAPANEILRSMARMAKSLDACAEAIGEQGDNYAQANHHLNEVIKVVTKMKGGKA